jgi:hypothetical protein
VATRAGTDVAPTADQVATTRLVTAWYLERYHGTSDDPGVVGMFTDPARVGHFAVAREALEAEAPEALFSLLVATTMFQRRQDLQIMRILRGISAQDASGLANSAELLAAADACGCDAARSLHLLLGQCDLRKDEGGQGACSHSPDTACAPKRHAVLLKRYGHFGKVPTSLALTLRAEGVSSLAELRRRCIADSGTPAEAARALEMALCRSWRVSDKIAAMYLSMLSNPDLWPGDAPWADGLDWRRWVVIDSNVDLFLASIGYTGFGTYEARRAFLVTVSAGIDLNELKPGLNPNNPRIIQQAAYLFMSVTNRRAFARDCSKESGACTRCAPALSQRCGMRRAEK